MKYLVVSTKRNESFEAMTITAELNSKEVAHQLMDYWNTVDKGQHTEIHPVMNDEDAIEFLEEFQHIYKLHKS